ncbi:MAG TPA: two-component regulator propeller domain-containing protein [Chitinophagaceae bacterium]
MKQAFVVLPFCLLVIKSCCLGQDNLLFNLVTNSNGASLGKIGAITQDRYGYIWFAAQDAGCIYRYDGYRLLSFKQDSSNANSLGGTYPETIYADSTGIIWVGFFGTGLDAYNPSTNQFKHFRHNINDVNSLSNDSVTQILRDSKGRVWIATQNGLNKLDERTGKFIHFYHNKDDSTSLSCNIIRALYEDRERTLWIGTGFPFYPDNTEGGLNRMNADGTFKQFLHNPQDSRTLLNNEVRSLFEDSHGNFWVGTAENGVHIMNRKDGTFKRFVYDPKNPDKLSGPQYNPRLWFEHITFITEDASGAIWMGTYASGITRYNPETKKVRRYLADNGFPDRNGWCAFTSSDGTLWISTNEPDLFRVNLIGRGVATVFTGNPVNCFYEDSAKTLWVGTDEKGILQFNQTKTTMHQYSSSMVHSILPDNKNRLWLGTGDSGVLMFNKVSKHFSPFPVRAETVSVIRDRDNNNWFATLEGLIKYNPEHNTFKAILPNARVLDVMQDISGFIWAGTYLEGLVKLDTAANELNRYLKNLAITCLYQSSDGIILVGTNKGLYKYDRPSDSFLPFFDPEADVSTLIIENIIEDDFKNVWISTNVNVIRLNAEKNKSAIYDKKYGITLNTRRPGICKTSDGKILLGNNKGFYILSPPDIPFKTEQSQIIITSFYVNDSLVSTSEKSILKKPIEETDTLELKHNQNHFSLNVALADYRSLENNKIFTRLDGFDTIWRNTSQSAANYFNVPAGTFTFRVKAFDSDGVITERSLIIIINPPWWETWWFRILSVISMVAVVYAIVQRHSRNLKKQNLHLEEKVVERTRELKQSLDHLKSTQAQLIQSEKMASLGELTAGIAHEIQNPLNFVNNFSEVSGELINEMKEELATGHQQLATEIADDIKQNLEKILHHGKRADAIVKGMLQHSRVSTGQKEPTDINALCDEYLRLSYHGMRAKDKNFNVTLQTDFDSTIGKINVVPQDIGRVMLNLFNNAFYACAERSRSVVLQNASTGSAGQQYKPTVSVCTKRINSPSGDGGIEIRVADKGNGIPQRVVDKIFQPFFTTKPTGQGTGLGLSLSYDIIKAHGGEIRVKSREGEGSEFAIQLPV